MDICPKFCSFFIWNALLIRPTYVIIKSWVSQGVYQWPSGWKMMIKFWKLTKLLTFSYGKNIFKKKNSFSFQTSNCYNSIKKEDIEYWFLANILIFIAEKDSSIKIWCYRGSWWSLFIFLGYFFPGALRGAPAQED